MNPPPVIPIRPAPSAPDGALFAAEARIYARSVQGWFARWRWVMVWVTQLVFYGLPWLNWNGRQAILFDIAAGRFVVFGLVLYPQDFIYLAALLVISALGLFFFTAVAGRLWCGYACPQTVYTEMFMWLELRIEGDRMARMRLDRAPWGPEKIARKGGKHLAWGLLAAVTGFTFVGYFTPIRLLAAQVPVMGLSPWEVFWIGFYGAMTYFNAGWLREQMCKYICPYARFQSALIDADSLIITYDARRGEPRGSRSRKAAAAAQGQAAGDCVDCTLCVQVCPTGIDIRHGLQNECIGCAACIDACDGVMDKIGAPRGLIRYATENGVARGWSRAQMLRRALRPRVLIYAAVLATVTGAFVTSLSLRHAFEVDVVKDRNTLARLTDQGEIENVYRLQIMNRREAPLRLELRAEGLPGLQARTPVALEIAPASIGAVTTQVRLPAAEAGAALAGKAHPIRFVLSDADAAPGQAATVSTSATFFVPR